jgi:hypothetical protein
VWWEAEEFQETNLPNPVDMRSPGNRNAEQQAKLSGGRWLTPSGPASDTAYFVNYEIEVPKTGAYNLWARKFWHHGPFRWRFGDDPWQVCDRLALHDHTFLELHWGAYWVSSARCLWKREVTRSMSRCSARRAVEPSTALSWSTARSSRAASSSPANGRARPRTGSLPGSPTPIRWPTAARSTSAI